MPSADCNMMNKETTSLLENMDRFEVTPVQVTEEGERRKSLAFSDSILKELTNQNGPYMELTNQEEPKLIEQLKEPAERKFSSVSRFSPAHNVTIINIQKGPELQDYYDDYFESDAYKVKKSRSLISKCCVIFALALILVLTSVLIVSTILLNVHNGHLHNDSSDGRFNLSVANGTTNTNSTLTE